MKMRRLSEKTKQILEIIKANPGITHKELCSMTKLENIPVRAALGGLRRSGLINAVAITATMENQSRAKYTAVEDTPANSSLTPSAPPASAREPLLVLPIGINSSITLTVDEARAHYLTLKEFFK
jgi:hypothetical protein